MRITFLLPFMNILPRLLAQKQILLPSISNAMSTLSSETTINSIINATSLPSSVQDLKDMTPEAINSMYRPFLQMKSSIDWVESLELETVSSMSASKPPLKLLILYGSLRTRSFSRLTSYEAARILTKLGADVRVFNPEGLPMKDEKSERHEKVLELRALSEWSEGQFWCSPEQHGTITGVFKNQSESFSSSRSKSY